MHFMILARSLKSLNFKVCEGKIILFKPSFHNYLNWSFSPQRISCVLSTPDRERLGLLILRLSAVAKEQRSGGRSNCPGLHEAGAWGLCLMTASFVIRVSHESHRILSLMPTGVLLYSWHYAGLEIRGQTKTQSSNTQIGEGTSQQERAALVRGTRHSKGYGPCSRLRGEDNEVKGRGTRWRQV